MGGIGQEKRAGDFEACSFFPGGEGGVKKNTDAEEGHAAPAKSRCGGVVEESIDGGTENFPSAEEEEAGHDHGGEDLKLAVAVRMFGIGRAGRGGDADEGDDAGGTIEEGVHGVGKNAQATEAPADAELEGSESDIDGEGDEEDSADASGAGGFAHDRRSAMPPVRGAR